MKTIKLKNTLKGEIEILNPLEKGKVLIYSCGPTVYDFAHIGNFRSFLMSDLLFRVLDYAGYSVTKVQNITDVGHLTQDDLVDSQGEDKILKKAKLEKKDPYEIARFFEEAFIEDEKVLRIIPPTFRPRATEFVKEQIEMTKILIEKGFAYSINGSVYFRTTKFKDYGKLSKNSLKDLLSGARVEVNDEKESPLDFALWKKAEEAHLMQWNFETCEKIPLEEIHKQHKEAKDPTLFGFPGWHIECSAMSLKLLGESFDIHTGGEDNIFPHHECEIAQNECTHGGKIKCWLHAKHLLVDGKKMSKSKGNFYTIRDLLEKGYSGETIRYALLSAHYRTALNFTFESLEMAKNSIARVVEVYRILKNHKEESTAKKSFDVEVSTEMYQKFLFEQDLGVSQALSVVFDLINTAMKARENNKLTNKEAMKVVKFLEDDFNCIFDVLPKETIISANLKKEIESKIIERKEAREAKDWAKADRVRDDLLAKGIELIDEAGKTNWKIKS